MIDPVRHPFPVYYCRHGQTAWNREDRLQGHADIPLNDKGRDQARGYGRALRALAIDWQQVSFFASPLSRAQETLEILAGELNLPDRTWHTDERLIELDLGDWNGLKISEVQRDYPAEWAERKQNPWTSQIPGGESYGAAEPRLRAFADSLSGASLVVGHGGTGRVFRGLLTHGDPSEFLKEGTRQDRVYILENGRERTLQSQYA